MSTYQSEQFPIPTPARLQRELRLPRPPWWMVLLLVVVVVGTWIPLSLIYQARQTRSPLPRVHVFLDMDQQPHRGPQRKHVEFLDGRAMRLPVEGTVSRGNDRRDDHWQRGLVYASSDPNSSYEFAQQFPVGLTIDGEFLKRGQQRYEIYCSVCHGVDGLGNGPVNRRAVELKEAKWVPATNLMTQEIRDRRDGQLVQAIRDGVRNMPAYRNQIDARDRWAIVAWVRQLQANSPVATPETKR
ncbi:MAG: cytochrome c [Pirellulaceae bacterium]|nr:cytochrome c [Pirellulaceae bacterium]